MKIGIGYAIYCSNDTHFDYAKQTLESIQSAEHDLVFCGAVNFTAKPEYDQYFVSKGLLFNNPENNVSMAWNRTAKRLFDAGCDYVIIPNLDVIFRSTLVDNLVRHAESSDKSQIILWTALPWNDLPTLENADEFDLAPETPHFSCFMIDKRLFQIVGEFDENFKPAYNEDIDMHWRITLANYKAVGYEGARFFHFGSRTIQSDPLLLQLNHVSHERNNKYFERKWGYKPATGADPFNFEVMYTTPFNRGF